MPRRNRVTPRVTKVSIMEMIVRREPLGRGGDSLINDPRRMQETGMYTYIVSINSDKESRLEKKKFRFSLINARSYSKKVDGKSGEEADHS